MAATACGGDYSDSGDGASSSVQQAATGSAPLVASGTLANGNELRFYDMELGAMVVEVGAAYSPPAYQRSQEAPETLASIWSSLVQDRSVPPALTDLEQRIEDNLRERDANPPPRRKPMRNQGADGATFVREGPVIMSPTGCNNGCCDFPWMYDTFRECTEDLDADWMLFNYGHTWANYSNVAFYQGFACSAEGTSRYYVHLGSAFNLDLDVAQAHYIRASWWAPLNWNPFWGGTFIDEDLTSRVNTSTNMHLHTYCGGVLKD